MGAVTSCSVKEKFDLNVNLLNNWIRDIMVEKGKDLFRYKGVLSVKGMKKKYVFQGVHMLFSGFFSDELLWKSEEERECRFVFIGRNIKKEELIKGIKECAVTKKLRFKVGDRVRARTGRTEFTPGKVIRIWDEGNPYRIELKDGERTNVWGPIDSDE